MSIPSFWRTFFATLRAAVLSRDTFIIFVGAVAFYLVFYAWPYGNQQIEHIPTAVLDLDQSSASRRLAITIDATPAANVVVVTPNESEAMDGFKRETYPILITIPEGFEEALTRGENMPIHILGNGAFPVKARAIQAAMAGVVQDKAKLLDQAAVYATGLPGTTVAGSYQTPPGLRVQYMWNEIGGYGNYTVPVVGPVILQAVMLMAITMAMGGWLVAARRAAFVKAALAYPGRRGLAVFLAFFVITYLWFIYMQGFDFWIHQYGSLANPWGVLLTGALLSAAICAFGIAITLLLGSNRWSSQAVVMISAPAVFLSGGIWPIDNLLNPVVYAFSLLIPTTPGIPALLAASQDGALTTSLMPHLGILFAQTGGYLLLSLWLARRLRYRENEAQRQIPSDRA